MKYYKELLELQCFTRADAVRLTGSEGAANSMLIDYQKKGYISHVKRNLYVVISMETGQPVASRYFIGSHITDGAYLSHHAAFEYYGCANQVFYEIYVSGTKRFAAFDYDDVTYRYIAPRIPDGIAEEPDGVRVTDMERTVLDSICDFEKIAGLEELLRCLELVPYLNEEKLLAYLSQYGKQILYQKAGYVLFQLKKELRLSDRFFEVCEKQMSKSVRYLYNGIKHEPSVFDGRWQLFVPQNLSSLLTQGGELHVDL
jgi:predicted transcriptional regulator of viral defense system